MGEDHNTALTGFSSHGSSHGRWLTWTLTTEACASLSLPPSPPLPHIHFTNTLQHLRARHCSWDCGSKGGDLEHPPQKSRQCAGEDYGHTNE